MQGTSTDTPSVCVPFLVTEVAVEIPFVSLCGHPGTVQRRGSHSVTFCRFSLSSLVAKRPRLYCVGSILHLGSGAPSRQEPFVPTRTRTEATAGQSSLDVTVLCQQRTLTTSQVGVTLTVGPSDWGPFSTTFVTLDLKERRPSPAPPVGTWFR